MFTYLFSNNTQVVLTLTTHLEAWRHEEAAVKVFSLILKYMQCMQQDAERFKPIIRSIGESCDATMTFISCEIKLYDGIMSAQHNITCILYILDHSLTLFTLFYCFYILHTTLVHLWCCMSFYYDERQPVMFILQSIARGLYIGVSQGIVELPHERGHMDLSLLYKSLHWCWSCNWFAMNYLCI